MANIIKLECCMFFLFALSYILSNRFVDGRTIGSKKNKEFLKRKGTIKTIEGEDGDIIDCVDIYQQPAFDHPLLENHTIQMKPSSIPGDLKLNSSQADLFQGWLRNGQCPKGTIPIIRRSQEDHEYARSIHLNQRRMQLNHSFVDSVPNHEYAAVSLDGNFYGAHASINVWKPVVYKNEEMSLAQIWVVSGPDNLLNSMEAGWKVDSGDQNTRFFIYWTSDGYQKTGCYNLDCSGFVQTNPKFALGSPIQAVSSYMSKQEDIEITIYKNSGNWWLKVQDEEVGYWPQSIFTYLANNATEITWGGEIYNSKPGGHHTSTQMGSGHFANEGYGKASYFRNIQYMDISGKFIDAEGEGLAPSVTNPSCYDLAVQNNNNDGYGTNFYFGGPGYSQKCP